MQRREPAGLDGLDGVGAVDGVDGSSVPTWSIRAAAPADADAWWSVHHTSMAETYPSMPPGFLRSRARGRSESVDRLRATLAAPGDHRHLVAVDAEGTVLGIGETCRGAQEWERRMLQQGYPTLAAGTGLGRGAADPDLLQLTTLYPLGRTHGSGLGAGLVRALVGAQPCYLWIMAGNDRAAAFYRRHGFGRGSLSVPSGASWYAWPMYQMVRG